MTRNNTLKPRHKAFIVIAGVITGLLLLVGIGLRVAFVPSVTNRLLSRWIPQIVRANIHVEAIHLRVFSTFPEAEIEMLQPLVQVAVPDTFYVAGKPQPFPHGDTLFAADTLRVRVRPLDIRKQHLSVGTLCLSHPRLYLTQYDSTANFDILPPKDEPDTLPSAPWQFDWEQVRLTDGRVCIASDSLGISHLAIDSIFLFSEGHYADSTLSAYLDAGLRCEDARLHAKGYLSDSIDMETHLAVPKIEKILLLLPDKLRQRTVKRNVLRGGILIDGQAQGYYTNGQIPRLHALVQIDSLHGGHPQRQARLDNLTLRAEAQYNPLCMDSTFVRVDTLQFHSGNSWLNAHGLACYREQREWVQLNLQSILHLRELVQLAALEERVRVRGSVQADMQTHFYIDDLLAQRIYDIHSASTLQGDNLLLAVPEARMFFKMDSLRAELKTNMTHRSRRTGEEKSVLLNMRVAFRQMAVHYRRSTHATIDRTMMFLYADELNDSLPPVLHASLFLHGVDAQHFDTIRLLAKRLHVSAGMRPDKVDAFVPTTTARISMDSVLLADPRHGTMLDSLRVNISTTPRVRKFRFNRETRERIPIPESELRPVPLDSLLRLANSVAEDSLPVESFIRKFRTTGKIYVRRLQTRRQNDPLHPTVSRMELTLNDDTVRLNSFRLRIGRSAVSLQGEVKHLRRYLLRGRTLDADLTLRSRRIDLNQLVNALPGQAPKTATTVIDSIAAKENMQLLAQDTDDATAIADTLVTDSLRSRLIALPSNLHVTLRASVDTIIFSAMRLNQFNGNLHFKDHTLSITNMSTSTKVGKMGMNLRYTCRDTTEATAAASLRMDSVQIGELVTALPELETMMPMLRSFDGSVASEAAVQCRLNNDLTIDLSSVNAGIWLRGENLVLMDGETFSEIAKQLMFSKKTRNLIDSLSVEVLVKNNDVEIFPFMIAMDKYRAGVGGKQHLDGSFKYHISLFKPIKLGLDVYGSDFDNIRYKLVKPQYQSASTKIGKGGTLLRQQDANVIPNMQKSIQTYILELSK